MPHATVPERNLYIFTAAEYKCSHHNYPRTRLVAKVESTLLVLIISIPAGPRPFLKETFHYGDCTPLKVTCKSLKKILNVFVTNFGKLEVFNTKNIPCGKI